MKILFTQMGETVTLGGKISLILDIICVKSYWASKWIFQEGRWIYGLIIQVRGL